MITAKQAKLVNGTWQEGKDNLTKPAKLVLAFGSSTLVSQQQTYDAVKKAFPDGDLIMCSTAGEILDTSVTDDDVVVTAVGFDSTEVKLLSASIDNMEESAAIGKDLGSKLPPEDLVHAIVFSDGLNVNGTALVDGLSSALPDNVSVTGGLVGDGGDFKHTFLGLNKVPQQRKVVLIGLYGKNLKIGYGSLGGWDTFGVERTITKSKGNVLYELDGESALAIYKRYLGEKAKELPGSGLLFPLSLRMKSGEEEEVDIVRTLLGVDEATGAMTFAGDMPEGTRATMMKANFERLVDGASGAASMSMEALASQNPDFALLISCVGRKLVLGERIEEEIESVRHTVGDNTVLTGFYSYGEICPTTPTQKQCQLHNQTMTITVFKET
jgi:hypothetical protein